MADTTFTDNITVVTAEWLNEANTLVHTILSAPTTAAEVNTALGLGTGSAVNFSSLLLGDASEGTSITIGGVALTSKLFVHAEGATDLGELVVHRHTDTAGFGGHIVLSRSRGTDAAETVVQSGDTLALIAAVGYDGTDYEQAAQIALKVDGTPGNNDMPGRIEFLTTPDGSSTPALAVRINQDKTTDFLAGIDITGNIVVSGTVDGRDIATDGTKLDGVEAGATADQTAAEIKTLYESNADTNAFTDAEQTKLTGIATGAEVNQNAFSNIAVSGQNTVVADAKTDTFTLVAGTDISITTNDTTDSITINSTAVAGNAFETINCPAGTDPVADNSTDTLNLSAGANITITGDSGTDTITFAVTGVTTTAFATINCDNGTDPVADGIADTLNLTSGTNMTITGDSTTDTITFAADAPSATNFDGGLADYVWDHTNSLGTTFTVTTSVTAATWESVGPTGSSADNIWAMMDDIPSSAKAVILKIEGNGVTSGTGAASVYAYCRKDGSAFAASSASRKLYALTAGTSGFTFSGSNVFAVPLDANNRFDIHWTQSGTSSRTITIEVVGFIK